MLLSCTKSPHILLIAHHNPPILQAYHSNGRPDSPLPWYDVAANNAPFRPPFARGMAVSLLAHRGRWAAVQSHRGSLQVLCLAVDALKGEGTGWNCNSRCLTYSCTTREVHKFKIWPPMLSQTHAFLGKRDSNLQFRVARLYITMSVGALPRRMAVNPVQYASA